MPAYFESTALRFLRSLARNNDREWFTARKATYSNHLQEPFLRLIEDVTHGMQAYAPAHIRPANKIALRIYRDTRFSANKLPYKTHVAAWWGRAGMSKTSGAGYYLHLSGKEVLLAAGLFMPTPEQLAAERAFLQMHGDRVTRLLADKRLRKLLPDQDAERMTRVPRGYAADSPHADLLRQRRWGVSATLPAGVALEASFLPTITRTFRTASTLIATLNEPLVRHTGTAGRKSLQALF